MAAQRRYPDELHERAVKMVFEIRERDGKPRSHSTAWCAVSVGRMYSARRSGHARRRDQAHLAHALR
jgi:hypothetical protein